MDVSTMTAVVMSTATALGFLTTLGAWAVMQYGGAAAATWALVALVKKYLPNLPTVTWPVLAVVFGCLLNGLLEVAQGRSFVGGVMAGVAAGAMAAWGKDVHKAVTTTDTPA